MRKSGKRESEKAKTMSEQNLSEKDRAHLSEYYAKHPQRRVVSKRFPPTTEFSQEVVYEHRNGARIEYVRGPMPPGQEDILEAGWCHHCAGVVSRSLNGKNKFMTTRPDCYALAAHHIKPCADCAPRVERVRALNRTIAAAQAEISNIAAEIEQMPLHAPDPSTSNPINP